MNSPFKLQLHDFWRWCPETGIQLEERYAAIPPCKRMWYQHAYLWYRRHFWYILALGGTILLALIVWDQICGMVVGSTQSQRGGANPLSNLSDYRKKRMKQLKEGTGAAIKGIKSAPGAAWKGAKAAPGAAWNAGASAAEGFKNASGKIYKWVFTIFILFAVGVFIMPTVVMIILGLLTFYIARGSLRKTVAM